ncbi:aldehyde dehydrogenase family protein [Streptomyces malaysiensis]|uniref:aldehyde dehydrogenase family protein n=1 Tax=Streptomyces malaysiensis TaxID=92644 RepID=UPI002B314EBC|nr:aldehyde dehydrogenase family protein [Streptomyces malaysiensis]
MNDFRLLINGELVAGDETMPVYNPATGTVFATSPRASRAQLDQAVAAAKSAFPGWAATDVDTRKAALKAIADAVTAHAEELVEVLIAEHGKPRAEAVREIGGTAGFFRFATTLDLPTQTWQDADGRNITTARRPLGPVAAIIPWNFPLLTVAFKLPSALLAGNTVVVKTSPTTPLTTLLFARIVAPLLPPGVLNVITDDNDLGDALTSHPDIRKVTFTGSTATGQRVMGNAVSTLKRLTLELGGNDAAIVLGDVKPSEVAPQLFRAAFQNNGQVCLAIKRLYVHDDVYDEICRELAKLADAAVVGEGTEDGVTHGPIQNKRQYDKLLALLEVARQDGTVIAGGSALERPGYFIRPTIVRDINDGSVLVDEEQFGPILPVISYSDIDEVIDRANSSGFALGASVWSADPERAADLAWRMDAGTVWVNKHSDIAPHIPFGGAKMSGVGTEFAQEGLYEFTQLKVINGVAS